MTPTRPILRYHGGKWKLAPWIIEHFPPHRVYVEPFGGAASVLLHKQRSYAEVYNDLDREIVGLFVVLRSRGQELRELLRLTPFSREDFLSAWYPSDDPMEQARRTVIRSFMGFGSAAATLGRSGNNTSRGGLAKTGFRANSNRSGTIPAHDWKNYPQAMEFMIDRLQGVVIENRPAIDVINQQDGEETLHYLDPPYVQESRDAGGDYAHEMADEQHVELAETVKGVKGMVVISGYHSSLYDRLFESWVRFEREALADGAAKRTEVLWLNGLAWRNLSTANRLRQGVLFAAV